MDAGPHRLTTEESLRDRLRSAGVVVHDDALRIVGEVARQVATLHEQGELHLQIEAGHVFVDDQGDVRVASPDSGAVGETTTVEGEGLPNELRNLGSIRLPRDISRAAGALRQVGSQLPPQRIDVYQTAALLCRLLTNDSADAYLRSPRVKQKVPPFLQPLLDDTLAGADAATLDLVGFRRRIEFAGANLSDEAETSSAASAASARRNELPFRTLGHYEILGRIGRGGMGDVYRGRDGRLQRDVAIKVLPPDLARQPEFVARFYAEASAAAKIVHPHVIPIYFIGEDHDHHFFAMQFVRGESLGELLARRRRLSLRETLDIAAQVVSGLAAAHRQCLVHRDIKPGNILLDHEHRRAILADFGLVKVVDSGFQTTAAGVVMGTADYISPEQGRGAAVDGRSDLYSLGVLLYQMVSGQLPFSADSATAMLFLHVYEQPRPLADAAPHVPKMLANVIMKLLAKDPAARFQSADELLAELELLRKSEAYAESTNDEADENLIVPELVDSPRVSAIIPAPKYDELPPIPSDLPDPPQTHWWRRSYDRVLGRFQDVAPEWAERVQNTQQLARGAVAEALRRRDELQQLVAQAASVRHELQSLADENRRAAQAAAQRAREADDDDVRREALRTQADCEAAAAELEAQVAEQQTQAEEMQWKLAQVQAVHEQLRSQRDQLEARYRAAEARYRLAGGPERGRKSQYYLVAVAGALAIVTFGCFAGLALWGWKHLSRSVVVTEGEETFTIEDLEPFVSEGYDPATLTPLKKLTPAAGDGGGGAPAVPLRQLVGHIGDVAKVAFSPSGDLLASTSYDASIRLWDPATGRNIRTMQKPQFGVYDHLQFTADGKLLVGASMQSHSSYDSIQVWDVATGRRLRSMAQETPIAQLGVDSGRRTVVGLRSDKERASLITWNLDSGQEVGEISVASWQVGFGSMALSPSGDLLALIVRKNQVVLLETATGTVRQTLETELIDDLKLAFNSEGTALAVGALGVRVMRYIDAANPSREFYGSRGDDFFHQVQVWKVDDGEFLGRFTTRSKAAVSALEFSPDGRRIAVATGDTIRIWDVRAALPLRMLRGHTSHTVAFSRDGGVLVSGGGLGKPATGSNLPFLLQWNVADAP